MANQETIKTICNDATSISAIKPILSNAVDNILKIHENEHLIAQCLKNAIAELLLEKTEVFHKVDDILHLASFMDPRFKSLCYLENSLKAEVLSSIRGYIGKYF